ncbi:hypothetical protein CKO09_11400 [Chromatium weissei]|nr:hypothetical protein [Chromatium weissei]
MDSIRLFRVFFTIILIGAVNSSFAEEAPTAAETWQRTRATATEWWQQSREYANEALQNAQGLLTEPKPQNFGQIWNQSLPKLEGALALEERQTTLPASAWFGASQASNRDEINQLLDQIVKILAVSPTLHQRERIQTLQIEIDRLREEIANARQQRVSAPTNSTLNKTVNDYDQFIANRENEITQRNQEIMQLKQEFVTELRATGLELDDAQVEFLLSTVVGDSLVDLGILFDNVKSMTQQLEKLVVDSGEDLQHARRYYGLYVVLLRAFARMHIQIEAAIREQYVPQIERIVTQAETLSSETRRLLNVSPEKRDLLNANLAAQQLTIEAAGVYRQYLDEQRRQVQIAREALNKDIEAAWNTYETVRVSGELVGLVKSSQLLLEGLMKRQIPALRPFANLEMQREFQKLTQQLRKPVTN